MAENPFSYGKPIADSTRFVGRQDEVRMILSSLYRDSPVSLVGEYRIGKSSLINYLADPSVHGAYGFEPNTFVFIRVDLQLIDEHTTPAQLWQYLLRQVAVSCKDTKTKQLIEHECESDSVASGFVLSKLFRRLDKGSQRFVFLWGEFDKLAAHQNFSLHFFYGLRAILSSHRLPLLISSRLALSDFQQFRDDPSSPLYNIFRVVHLGLFTEEESRHLITSSLVGTGIGFTDAETNLILRIAGHHPYFLQVASFHLFEAYTRNLDPDDRTIFLQKALERIIIPHLEDYWQRLKHREKIALTALALVERQTKVSGISFQQKQLDALYTHYPLVFSELGSRGLVVQNGSTYSLFSDSFGTWICDEIINMTYDQQSYDDWLRSNEAVMKHFSTPVKKEIARILPKIADKYRDLIITWVSDPKTMAMAMELLKGILRLH